MRTAVFPRLFYKRSGAPNGSTLQQLVTKLAQLLPRRDREEAWISLALVMSETGKPEFVTVNDSRVSAIDCVKQALGASGYGRSAGAATYLTAARVLRRLNAQLDQKNGQLLDWKTCLRVALSAQSLEADIWDIAADILGDQDAVIVPRYASCGEFSAKDVRERAQLIRVSNVLKSSKGHAVNQENLVKLGLKVGQTVSHNGRAFKVAEVGNVLTLKPLREIPPVVQFDTSILAF